MPRRPNRRTNARIAPGIATTHPDAASWIAFDALPRKVRRALWEAPVSINPLSARQLVEIGGVDYAVEELRSAVAGEIRQFAAEYERRHGSLTHVAAEASVMRY